MTAPVSDQHAPDSPSRRQILTQEIAAEEARFVRLQTEHAASGARLRALRAEAASLGSEPQIRVRLPAAATAPVPISSADKVRLFRSLFRGRVDVFPTRFVAKKTGKSGYAPACRNKFVRGVCELPKVKCGECPNQAFVSFDDDAVVGHLTGRHVMGVYPLLDDETCWFLAVDFDGKAASTGVARGASGSPVRPSSCPSLAKRRRSGSLRRTLHRAARGGCGSPPSSARFCALLVAGPIRFHPARN